jgi:hypothetical protein
MAQTTHPVDQNTVERDTTVDTTETPTRDAQAREPGGPSRRSRRGLSWLAVGAALAASVGFAVVVLTSGGNRGDRPAVTPAEVNGSDVHLYNLAAEIAERQAQRADAGTVANSAVIGSDVHLYNLAAEIAERQAQRADAGTVANSAVIGSDVHLYNQAAEIANRAG